MKDICILSDFDGTITERDGLYEFFSLYAKTNWLEIEKLWEENKINSKECLLQELKCIKDLDENLINKYIKTVAIDKYFFRFHEYIKKVNIDFYIVSDGVDLFIKKILNNNNIENIEIISNHMEFEGNKFFLTFPNEDINCRKKAGTCKCNVIKEMRKKYKKIIYIGDGTSDYCVCDKADILFSKGKLIKYCRQNKIDCIEFETFNDITLNLISKIKY